MAGYVRRYTSEPTIDQIRAIEGPVIIDLAPPPPVTGAGSGAVLLVGEMEDGAFAADTSVDGGVREVYGSADLAAKFGGFGYKYGNTVSQNPCARKHLQELWNGNGFLKLYRMRAQRLMIARVDTSVGSVSFDPLASVTGKVGPYALANGQQLTCTTTASAASTAVSAAALTVAGIGAAMGTVVSGDKVGFSIDGGPRVNVTFTATDTTATLVAARINAALGYTAAAVNGTNVDITAIKAGYNSSITVYDDLVPGAAAKIGHIAGVWTCRPRVVGGATNLPGIAAADKFTINTGAGVVTITFSGTPANAAAAVLEINQQYGSTIAYVTPNSRILLHGGALGTTGSLVLATGSPDALVDLGHAAGTTNGVYNVGDVSAVTAAEVAAIINGTAGLSSITVSATVTPSGQLRVYNSTAAGTLRITSGAMATALLMAPVDTTVAATGHTGGTIPAGTRVTNGSITWVTMQTVTVASGAAGPFTVKVRHALDDGTGASATAATVTTLTDPPAFWMLKVTNPAGLTAALTEAQLDTAYKAALDATLDEKSVAREANYLLSARRSDSIVRDGLSNVRAAIANGLVARKFVTGDPLGTTVAQAVANVAVFAGPLTDVMFYTSKGLKVRVAEIAAVGTAGGIGFTADGVITVRPDGPLTTICATLPPENNPGEATGLIEDFYEVDAAGETLDRSAYEAFRRAGICAPRRDRQSGMVFQSGVTSCTDPARQTIARRKMADYIQDTAAELMNPFTKQLSRQSRRDQIRSVWEQFLASLKSENSPELARIVDYAVDDSVNAGNTEASLALGVYYIETRVKTLASLDNIVVRTEVGEGVVISAA